MTTHKTPRVPDRFAIPQIRGMDRYRDRNGIFHWQGPRPLDEPDSLSDLACLECPSVRRTFSRGLCRTCWNRHSQAGTLHQFPTATELAEQQCRAVLAQMVDAGWTVDQIAAAFGIKKNSAYAKLRHNGLGLGKSA